MLTAVMPGTAASAIVNELPTLASAFTPTFVSTPASAASGGGVGGTPRLVASSIRLVVRNTTSVIRVSEPIARGALRIVRRRWPAGRQGAPVRAAVRGAALRVVGAMVGADDTRVLRSCAHA